MTLALKQQSLPGTDEQLWQAVIAKDASFDGSFVFAVSSTHIYCRPSCTSRRARREHVSFYSSPEAAEAAGYRACLRCQPQAERMLDAQTAMVERVCRYLDTHNDEPVPLSHLAKHAGVSVFHLQRTFKQIMGISPREYVSALRFKGFRSRVRRGESVTGALYDSGFNSSSRLYERAGDELGMTPATYGRGGRGVKITFTTVQTVLGRLLVAATERGICAVRMADRDEELERDLREEFAAASIERNDSRLRNEVEKVLSCLDEKAPRVDLPLDIRATAFQRQVWDHLRKIPYGQTVSYGDVAKALGNPGAVRAVGRACATNPVALVIPCHRVVREDKTLGGYRWGLERKKKLLEQESAASDQTGTASHRS